MVSLVLNSELLNKAEHAAWQSQVHGCRAAQKLDGNPFGFSLFGGDEPKAFGCDRLLEQTEYHQIRLIGRGDVDRLDDLTEFFRELGSRPRLDTLAPELDAELGRSLFERGFLPDQLRTLLGAQPLQVEAPRISPGVTVRPAEDDDLDTYVRTWLAGFEVPDPLWSQIRPLRRAWFSGPDYQRFVAIVDGEVAGIAGLYLGHDCYGVLEDATTLPEFRGRGVLSKLAATIAQRTAQLGCDLIISETPFDSAASHSLERCGMRVLATKTTWRPTNGF